MPKMCKNRAKPFASNNLPICTLPKRLLNEPQPFQDRVLTVHFTEFAILN
uniref:Uncharacterized protein n=1 Tax=Anguilla anguilla TaxID=7936 RepID=A0A0E9VT89_ANGAN